MGLKSPHTFLAKAIGCRSIQLFLSGVDVFVTCLGFAITLFEERLMLMGLMVVVESDPSTARVDLSSLVLKLDFCS
jgi:hypothetical protein